MKLQFILRISSSQPDSTPMTIQLVLSVVSVGKPHNCGGFVVQGEENEESEKN